MDTYGRGDDGVKNKTIALLAVLMIWLSALVIWAVDRLENTFKQYVPQSLTVANMPSGPIITSQSLYTVPVGNNTVWIIDTAHQQINVITHDISGYHSKLVPYDSSYGTNK